MRRFLKFQVLSLFSFLLVASIASAQSAPRVLMVSPEQTRIFQTGGLAHATTGLAKALTAAGVSTEVLMPFYLEMNAPENLVQDPRQFAVELDWRNGRSHKTSTFGVLTNPDPAHTTHFFRHTPPAGVRNYFDNRSDGRTRHDYAPADTVGESFGAFAKAAADFILSGNYDLIVLNDWTTGLIATHLEEARLQGRRVPRVVFAIHNIAYQGLFPKSLVDFLGLSQRHYQVDGYEYHGQVNFLKAGIQYADLVYTVSQMYADEIMTPRFGMGLDGLMRRKHVERRLTGILNGIDSAAWDPRVTNPHLTHRFSENHLEGKARGKSELQQSFRLPVDSRIPVFILTSRLAEQKGFEYMIDALADAAGSSRMQVLIIGDGEPDYVEKARDLERRFPDQVRYSRFSAQLERVATAYGDFFVNGAWFEPSGLNQFFALANGTIPIVSRVGGLASSVHEGINGFLFQVVEGRDGRSYDVQQTRNEMSRTLRSAVDLFQNNPGRITEIRKRGMRENNSWASRVVSEFLPMFDYVLRNGPASLRGEPVRPDSPIASPTTLRGLLPVASSSSQSRVRTCRQIFQFAL